MIEIECLVCEKSIKPRQLNDSENYDTDHYDGQIPCPECKSLLYVKLLKGKVQKYKILEDKSRLNYTEFVFKFIRKQKLEKLTELLS